MCDGTAMAWLRSLQVLRVRDARKALEGAVANVARNVAAL